ncbi:MAG: hypothetical protein ACI9U2_001547 [Bradymonadia bacterium]|jgi:hypothetical protein
MRLIPILLLAVVFAGCGSDPEPPSPAREYSSLAWKLKTALEADTSCRKTGAAVAKWEAEDGKRFAELVATVPKLTGGHANNYQSMQMTFQSVAQRCIRPKHRMPPLFEHNADVARVYKMLPKMTQGFEMR